MIASKPIYTFESLLRAMDTMAGLFAAGAVRLFANDRQPSPLSVLSDFVEAAFVGYVPSLLPSVTTPVFDSAEMRALVTIFAATFKWTGAVGSHDVYGYYLTDLPPTKVWLAGRFTFPFTFKPGQAFLDLEIDTSGVSEITGR